ncbi:sigma-54-dependent transcriptional regulator [Burkholderia sp. PAMC 26561]|jgi:DNA-binding NtrC family response regulator|uniref:sigma-54-dependent transcriptional regulator n=1 Tax=Burkholderia sp. PAMC 26561 TaxID=1795043 RepID=UPI00076AE74B|nr:sigma-54 dependent transcriptional regulator [Burkholderia sp. PAMC 26561]AME25939.1 AAA family ATPase [Burkholderia sp. PAMC 26561]
MAHILIVDDDGAFRESLAETLADMSHETLEAASKREALALLESMEPIDCVFLDLRMPDGVSRDPNAGGGLEVLEELRNMPARAALPVVVLTAFATSENTVRAMRLGAFDHLTKPIGRDQIAALLKKIELSQSGSRDAAPIQPNASLLPDEAREARSAPRLLGFSDALRDVQKSIGRAAATDATVLINGETGTGKEVAARVLHDASDRRQAPFIAVNCAAIPADLLESELFGHTKGAFTGAVSERLGQFARADGGTLFLDEIGDLPWPLQAKLLRVLQERIVTPVGSNAQVRIDVRIVAATHRDLQAEVAAQRFREDLFYRLNVIPIHLPPLRERPADIAPLAAHFLAIAATGSTRPKTLGDDAKKLLLQHAWPGNVRELKNAMERVFALARGPVVVANDLAFLSRTPGSGDTTSGLPAGWLDLPLPDAVEQLERLAIAHALSITSGNRAEAARRLGISRQSLYTKLAAYGLG